MMLRNKIYENCVDVGQKKESIIKKNEIHLILFLIIRVHAEVRFPYAVPDKISMESLLNSKKKKD